MKAIPYLRFILAIFVSYNFINQTISESSKNEFEFLFTIFTGLLVLGFVVYSIVVGLQEIRGYQIFNARFLEYFGILFQLLIFLGSVFVISFLVQEPHFPWSTTVYIAFSLVLLTLLIVDIKRVRSVKS